MPAKLEVKVERGDIASVETEAVVLGIFKDTRELSGAAKAVDDRLEGQLTAALREGDFTGKKGETLLLRTFGKLPAKRVLLVGLGEREKFNLEVVREASAAAAKAGKGFPELASVVHGAGVGGLAPDEAAQTVVEGALLGLYRFDKYKTKPKEEEEKPKLERLRLVEFDPGKLPQVEEGARRGEIIAESVVVARDLANEPGLTLTPTELARRAEALAHELGLEVRVLDEPELEREGMGGLLGVARGSDEPAKFIILEYNADAKAKAKTELDTIVLVGKGITFDSGGISLKPAEAMGDMKFDMSGAAAVLGTLRAAALLKLPVHLVGLIPATENLPSGKALKPGDIVRFANGKTAEIVSTDAEGRLILADALAYAKRFEPKVVIDLATLTGACIVALGHHASGLFSNDDSLVERMERAAEKSGERVWHLPLYEEYSEQIKSEVADIKNTGGRPAGAATAAAFLKEFVDYPWVHLDIAGTAFNVEGKKYIDKKGATGVGVRLLVEFLRDWTGASEEGGKRDR